MIVIASYLGTNRVTMKRVDCLMDALMARKMKK